MRKNILNMMFILLLICTPLTYSFNTTELENSDNLYEFTVNLNTLLDDLIGIGIIIMVFFITFVVVQDRYNDTLSGIGAGGFIGTLTAIMFLPLGLIGFHIFRYLIVITAVSTAAAVLLRGR